MLRAVVVIGVLLTGCQAVAWSSDLENGASVYVCEGRDLTLPWKVTPGTGENIIMYTWSFAGSSQKTIAVYSRNIFFPTEAYGEQVKHLGNGAILVKKMTQKDAGTYSVEINIRGANGVLVTHRRFARVHVATVSSARLDATMLVSQNPVAVYSSQTQQFHLQLTCRSRGLLPSAVVWKDPSHRVLGSSSLVGNTFTLQLTNPVRGGSYSCRIHPTSPAASCLPSSDSILQGASVFVDEIRARMTVMEASVTSLQAENTALKNKRVMFHAYGGGGSFSSGRTIRPSSVRVNLGNGYNSQTGYFTAPHSGYYFFTATAAGATYSTGTSYYANLYLMVNGAHRYCTRSKSVSYYEQATCSYAGYLGKGQQVWLQAWGSVYLDSSLTMFTGFLVTPS